MKYFLIGLIGLLIWVTYATFKHINNDTYFKSTTR